MPDPIDSVLVDTVAVDKSALRTYLRLLFGDQNTRLGVDALTSTTTGRNNNAFGKLALNKTTTGQQNNAHGVQALEDNTTGFNNDAFGNGALADNTIGSSNNAFGTDTLRLATTASGNSAFGTSALQNHLTGGGNSAFGNGALLTNLTGADNVALGTNAGKYELGSNKFYVDNADRTNTAGDVANALMYGEFAAAAVNQRLRINAALTLPVQPAFLASAQAEPNITGDGTVATLTWNDIYDQSVAHSGGNFTASEAGTHAYHFDVGVSLSGLAAGNTLMLVTLVTSNRSIELVQINPSAIFTTGGELIIRGSTDVDMEAGDTAHVTLRVDGGAKIVDTKANGTFSGRLVC